MGRETSHVLTPPPAAHAVDPAAVHLVQFYENDAFLVETTARFIGSALGAGDAAVVIATERHRLDLETRLAGQGLNLDAAREAGRFFALDAAATLSKLVIDGVPDATRFAEVVAEAIARAADGGRRRVHAFGEMVALLYLEGRREAAVRLEELWNDLAVRAPFSLLCAYPLDAFHSERDREPFLRVCAAHSEVLPAESFAALESPAKRLRVVAELQQKARTLEGEIAQRKEAQEALQKALGEAEAANRAKDEFLAMLGHELRNPLASVKNAVLTARLDPARREQALEIAHRGSDKLGRLVDDLLDVARITQGKIALRLQRLPFAGIVRRALESTQQLVEELGHSVAVLALPGNEVQVDGDSTRLEQVIVNLISNAAKYTEPGGRITLTAEHRGNEVVLHVRDQGMGIAPEMLPRVFDLFAQADRALDRTQGGLGVGLTVVKRLVELHGGRIEAYSEGVGKGAEFVVRLPATVVAAQESRAVSSSEDVRRSPARVLLVEDNADAAESLVMLLELLGHRVRVVNDGQTALDVARANVPDVMLVDIGLPGMDGYEVARQVRQDPKLRHALLVALTGYGRDEDRQRALAAGFDAHLVKPVNADVLQGLVAKLSEGSAPAKDSTLH
jgi:signal transduction histidine kinase/ActR/RegA family two-component response regulator